ncbi:MAG: DUF4391 domain-containing protein [Bacteroides uniformis]
MQKVYSDRENTGFSVLYDRENYIYDSTGNQFKPKKCKDLKSIIPCSSDKEILMEEMGNGIYGLFQIEQAQDINLDFANELQKYGLGIIYPLPLAKDYVDNDFRTLEQRHYEKEMNVALQSAKYSRWAMLIAFFSLMVSVAFGMWQVVAPQEIEPKQINTIETAIKSNRIDDPLKVEIRDTILIKSIENNKPTNSCHQQKSRTMYGLPTSTECKRQLPKKAIYAKFDLNPSQREGFDTDIARLDIVAVVSPATVPALSDGLEVKEFYVLAVLLKHKEYDSRNIALLVKLIPQNMVLALQYEEQTQFAVFHTKLITSAWQPTVEATLPLSGLNLDAVWENLVKGIGQIDVADGNTLTEQIISDNLRAKLLAKIVTLEKKMANEKQPKKSVNTLNR